MRIVALSDTHGLHRQVKVPIGHLLIFAGDACNYGTLRELADFAEWWNSLTHRYKVLVAGNHDWPFQRDKSAARGLFDHRTFYLEDDAITINGVRVYGSPWQPEFCGWAFNLPRVGGALERRWANIPDNVDILVTHGPASRSVGVLQFGEDVGDEALRERIEAVTPRWHLCGHIHEGAREGVIGTTQVRNVSICDAAYNVARAPIVFDLQRHDDDPEAA